MKPETRITLLKELEKMENKHSRDLYKGAWNELILSIGMISTTFFLGVLSEPGANHYLRNLFIFVVSLYMLAHSLYVIIRYKINSRLIIIYKAVLESKDSEKLYSENSN